MMAGTPASPTTEERILEAGERLVARVPLREVTVKRVVDEAKVSRATFYFYFKSKEALLSALVRRAMADLDAGMRPHLAVGAGAGASQGSIRRRVEAAAAAWRRHGPVLRATSDEWHAVPELREIWLAIIADLTTGVAAEIEAVRRARGETSELPARALAAVLAWSVERCLYVGEAGIPPFGEADTVGEITAMWQGTVYGESARPSAGRAPRKEAAAPPPPPEEDR